MTSAKNMDAEGLGQVHRGGKKPAELPEQGSSQHGRNQQVRKTGMLMHQGRHSPGYVRSYRTITHLRFLPEAKRSSWMVSSRGMTESNERFLELIWLW